MAITGLDPESATLAKDRHHCETLVWLGTPSDRSAFAEQVEALDLRCRAGGTLRACNRQGRQRACHELAHHKIRAELLGFETAVSIAAGDADNDVEMLE